MSESPFYTARLSEWAQQIRMWPVAITNNNETATCIMTPERNEKRMIGHAYMDVVMATMDALRADCERLGIKSNAENPRPRFTVVSSEVTYEIQKTNDDPNEPTLQMQCARVQ